MNFCFTSQTSCSIADSTGARGSKMHSQPCDLTVATKDLFQLSIISSLVSLLYCPLSRLMPLLNSSNS